MLALNTELSSFSSNVRSIFQAPHVHFLLPRDAMHKRGLCRHAVSVYLSRSWIMSKRIKISSKFFHHWVATPF